MDSKTKRLMSIILAILVAAVMAFALFSFAACGGSSDDDEEDDEQIVPTPDEGGDSGDSGDSGSGDSGSQGTTEDGGFVLQGSYFGSYYGTATFNADGSGYFETSQSGEKNDMFSGDVQWSYDDETLKNSVTGEMSMFGSTATFQVTLSYVNGELVAGNLYIAEINVDYVMYDSNVTAALQATDNSAYVVLKNSGEYVYDNGSVSTGTWEWTTDASNVTITSGGSTYTSTSLTTDSNDGTIRAAEFSTLEGKSDVSFLPINDPSLVGAALYTLESSEGYTLSLYEDGTFITLVGDLRYTGDYNLRNTTLSLQNALNEDDVYSATVTLDDDGAISSATFASYFGGLTDVTFEMATAGSSREDNAIYQEHYNSSTHGTAIAVFTGIRTDMTTGELYDSDEYWIFIYPDGTFDAHYSVNFVFGNTTGNWTWATNDDGELVPTFIRNPGQTSEQVNYATMNADGTYSFNLQSAMSSSTNSHYTYTFSLEDMPAGSFAGTVSGDEESTYYLVLYLDGTFKAHIGATNTSDGYWEKYEDGTIEFGKLSADYSGYPNITYTYVPCTSSDNADGTVTVTITNYSGTEYYYVVDPSVVPVGGADLSQYK